MQITTLAIQPVLPKKLLYKLPATRSCHPTRLTAIDCRASILLQRLSLIFRPDEIRRRRFVLLARPTPTRRRTHLLGRRGEATAGQHPDGAHHPATFASRLHLSCSRQYQREEAAVVERRGRLQTRPLSEREQKDSERFRGRRDRRVRADKRARLHVWYVPPSSPLSLRRSERSDPNFHSSPCAK